MPQDSFTLTKTTLSATAVAGKWRTEKIKMIGTNIGVVTITSDKALSMNAGGKDHHIEPGKVVTIRGPSRSNNAAIRAEMDLYFYGVSRVTGRAQYTVKINTTFL